MKTLDVGVIGTGMHSTVYLRHIVLRHIYVSIGCGVFRHFFTLLLSGNRRDSAV